MLPDLIQLRLNQLPYLSLTECEEVLLYLRYYLQRLDSDAGRRETEAYIQQLEARQHILKAAPANQASPGC